MTDGLRLLAAVVLLAVVVVAGTRSFAKLGHPAAAWLWGEPLYAICLDVRYEVRRPEKRSERPHD